MHTKTPEKVVRGLVVSALLVAAALATSTTARATTTVFVDKRSVVTEQFGAPLKSVTNSSASIARLDTLVDDWVAHRDRFTYGPTENLFKYGSRPVADSTGRFEIDCSSFEQAVLEGITYGTSVYTPSVSKNYSTFGSTMPFSTLTEPNRTVNRRLVASQLAEWAYDHGYWFAARPDFTNVEVGDALFWHAYPEKDANGDPIWKRVSHVGFVTKVMSDGYFQIADASDPSSLTASARVTRRTLHATDLHRLQVYSAARFPLDQMWTWGSSTSRAAVELGWTFDPAAGRWTYRTGSTSKATGWSTIDGKKYYFTSAGYALFGQQSIGGTTYYIDENRGSVSAATWQSVLAERDKYFGAGSAVYDHFTTATRGWQRIDGAWYYFIPSTGYMVRNGWQSVYEPTLGRSSWNYCRRDGRCIDQLYVENGMTFMSLAGPKDYARGWYTVDGFTRYFRETQTASMATGFQKIDGSWYYLRTTSGTKATGWQFVGDRWHYLDPKTGVLVLDGWRWAGDSWDYHRWSSTYTYYSSRKFGQAPDGKTYYSIPGPKKYYRGYRNINDNWYYFGTDGAMVKGWFYSDGTWHYYRKTTGTSVIGRASIGGKWYTFQSYKVGVKSR
ncbi:N-acetylmuramoyl-L-alanine amidase family protein [Phycicoccus flavus]|uniref:N-acetylmuramoyl-L-alanine amidase family protein n=1 Tax=Phycicoccus flavus TaxID=2502783 RepID=UPI000FEC2050|nr:hypothetical protein [Phycicoccus flavus]NHA66685.1 hypothetical protein [Phycicoccus flavus]